MIRRVILDRLYGRLAATALRWGAIAIVVGGILGALGPFGSYMNGGPIERTGYWIGAMLLGLMVYGTAFRFVASLARIGSPQWWAALVGVTLLASIPETIATRAAAFWLWPELGQLDLSWSLWFAQTTIIGLVAMGVAAFIVVRAVPSRSSEPGVAPPSAAGASLLGRDVLALEMEDHYVRVHRANGSALVLLPLVRAIDSVGTAGLRIHRSWWVASHAVQRVEGNARSMRLHLTNGVIAPVARSAVIHLKAAGWIPGQPSDGVAGPATPPLG